MYHWIIYIFLLVTVQLDDTYKLLINNVCNIYKWFSDSVKSQLYAGSTDIVLKLNIKLVK
jgi:hypothetical protein